jgi:hypothetical protein
LREAGQRLVGEHRQLRLAEAIHADAVEELAVRHQECRLVVDAAVGVHTAPVVRLVVRKALVLAHAVRLAEGGRIGHVADRAAQRVLADRPVGVGRIAQELVQRSHDVGEALVEGARLSVVDEIRGEVVHAVSELVREHVARDLARIEDQRVAGRPGGRPRSRVAYDDVLARAIVVVRISAELQLVEVVGRSGLGDRQRRIGNPLELSEHATAVTDQRVEPGEAAEVDAVGVVEVEAVAVGGEWI